MMKRNKDLTELASRKVSFAPKVLDTTCDEARKI